MSRKQCKQHTSTQDHLINAGDGGNNINDTSNKYFDKFEIIITSLYCSNTYIYSIFSFLDTTTRVDTTLDIMSTNNFALFTFAADLLIESSIELNGNMTNSVAMSLISDIIDPIYVILCSN